MKIIVSLLFNPLLIGIFGFIAILKSVEKSVNIFLAIDVNATNLGQY